MSEQGAGAPVQPAAEGGEGEGSQIGQLLQGFETFRGEISGRLDALENDLFEPEGEGGPEPGGFPGASDFPAIGAQPPMGGQPTWPAAPPPGVVPQQQGQQWPQDPGQYPGQQQQQPQQAPGAMPPDAVAVLDQFIGQRLAAGMQQQQQALEQRMTQAFSAQQQRAELDQYADQLERQYPEFQDEQHTARLLDATAQFAQQLGRPELASDPRLLERVLLAERAQSGQAAQPAPGQEVHLETSTAAPGAPTGEVDPAAGIVAAAKGRRLL